MTEQEKIDNEASFLSLARGYLGTCCLGGLIWIVLAMESQAMAVMLSIGVGAILTGAMVFCGIRLLVGISHTLRVMLQLQREALVANTAKAKGEDTSREKPATSITLVTCSACSKQVNRSAAACTHCGALLAVSSSS